METNILEYLEYSAKQYGNKIAIADEHHQISYSLLANTAQRIGSYISSKAIYNEPIAVLIDRNLESIVAFLGIVYSGNFYVPIDNQLPAKRIELILNTLAPKIIISTGNSADVLSESPYRDSVVKYEEISQTEIQASSLECIRAKHIDTNPLYAIFTSGSTGIPKGVLISHRSVIDLVNAFSITFDFQSADVLGNQAPFDFDVSVKDIYMTLKIGATLEIIPKRLFSTPLALVDYLNKHMVSICIWATSALCIIANFKTFSKTKPNFLRYVMFSGEVMPNKVLNYWRKNLPTINYVNLYGPTEITCNCTYFKVCRPFLDTESLPIGVPFPNTKILLLNSNNQLAGPEELGEICVAGTSLALGYYNDFDKTQSVFSQNPLQSHYPEMIYRTGDLGRYNEYGELLFVSRKDFQIKHLGHRIELGELEIAINSLPFVELSCCLYDKSKEKIICFYQSASPCNKEILLGLKKILPKYMWPNMLIHFDKIPMNKNNKIDRSFLKEHYIKSN